jgi:hypothetical protein
VTIWQVRIEFQRVQTFLFAVPRLLDILGANTLLGETLRQALSSSSSGPMQGAAFPPGIILPSTVPTCDASDPLTACVGSSAEDADNPKALYERGILARDGGHFQALFADEPQAEAFQIAAETLIRRHLPGLRFDVSTREIPPPEPKKNKENRLDKPIQAKSAALLALPALQVCEELGRGIASHVRRYADGNRYMSHAVRIRKERGEAFRNPTESEAPPQDIASLLAGCLPRKKPAETFDALCAGEYLALIHADGNGIGDWSSRVRGKLPEKCDLQAFIDCEARGEAFYHAMRVAVRKAVVSAIDTVFKASIDAQSGDACDPYRLLMLGGDDLLLVCRARFALPFVHAYAEALTHSKLPDCNEAGEKIADRPLAVGVGVAIAKPSFPFHRLHQIAEELASSAKRLVRGERAPHASVVDWTICTEAWMDSVEAARADSVVRYGDETLALSSKPYFILKQDQPDAGLSSLQALLDASDKLKGMPRSQRRALASELRRGRRHAELWAQELKHASPKAWGALKEADWVDERGTLKLWRDCQDQRYATAYADAVELTEIPLLKLGDERPSDRDTGEDTA